MGHEIYDHKFYTRNGPAWHRIGIVGEQDEDALQVYERLGAFDVTMQPLFMVADDGTQVASPYAHIVRSAKTKGGAAIIMGKPVRRDSYVLVSHRDIVQMAHAHIRHGDGTPARIETMGYLGDNGRRLFMSYELPQWDVKGLEVRNFLILMNPIKPGSTVRVIQSSVLPVCWNTWLMAVAKATYQLRVPHSEGAHARIATALDDIYGSAVMTNEVMREAAELLSKKRVTSLQIHTIATDIYAYPPEPRTDIRFKTDLAKRRAAWEEKVEYIDALRAEVVELFEGKALGLDNPHIAGTGVAGMQAFSQLETYRYGSDNTSVQELFVGERGDNIRAASTRLLNLAGASTRARRAAVSAN